MLSNNNAHIWRFIDLPKFLDMLVTGSLYFTRGDMFDGPYEGMPPDEYMEVVRRCGSNAGSVQQQTRMFHYYRADFFINCWHMSPHESAGMWKLYAGVDAGIAIKSTYSRLVHAFKDTPERVYLGLTSYDHEHVFGSTNSFKFSSYKRQAFGHDREVRAMILRVVVGTEDHDHRSEIEDLDRRCCITDALSTATDTKVLADLRTSRDRRHHSLCVSAFVLRTRSTTMRLT